MQDYILEIVVPMMEEIEKKTAEKSQRLRRFSRYVLIKMILTDESWFAVRNTRGVTGFVGPGSNRYP